jgi:NitT/TauT family transport system substrate-binding protein
MKTLIVEHTAPFQGLPELVADAEGLFAREGLQIVWANTNEGADRDAATDVLSPKGLDPFRSHGRLLEQGKADMYNACEWGNYCRVQDTAVGSRQLGRRGIVTFAAIVVAPDSPIYTPQQLAYRKVGVPFYFDLLMRREIEGTTLTEPYVTLAEKKGCRVVCSAFYHGTQVGTEKIDVETMRAYNRAVGEAVRRIDANRRKYLQYFIDYHKAKDPEIGTLTVDDLRESRLVVCEPAPIPRDEMQRTYEWVRSWGMLEATQSPLQLVDVDVQTQAHATG